MYVDILNVLVCHSYLKEFAICTYYTAAGGDYSKNHKSIWISFSLYSKIRVNNNSHRFVIIKPQDIFGLSKNTLPSKFCPICFVFVGFVMAWFLFLFNYVIKNHATFYINKRVTNFHELFQDFWGLIITNLYELLFTRILEYRLKEIQIDLWFLESSPPVAVYCICTYGCFVDILHY